jgi:hypothetical protein
MKLASLVVLLPAILALVSLLVWLPAPGSAGTKVFAWLWICSGAILLYTLLIASGNIGKAVERSPYTALVGWVGGMSEKGFSVFGAGYLALVGYGLASVFGKKLE